MSFNDQGRRLCAGCGAPGCGCTPDVIKTQLEKDRAEVSNRAATVTQRSLELAGELLRLEAVRAHTEDRCACETIEICHQAIAQAALPSE